MEPVLTFISKEPFLISSFINRREKDKKKTASIGSPSAAVLRVLWTIEKTGVDASAGRATRILLQGGDARDLGGEPEVVVREHRVGNQRVIIAAETSAPCFARLAYAYYPHVDVLVNGTKVQALQTVGGFIALELGRGRQRIELVPRLSTLRRGLLWLNGLVLVVMGGLALREYRRTKII